MLTLKGITKHYKVAGGYVEALKGLDISFRKNEFVSILGPSGCGKTTTLNIIGGLDKYTSGDLIIAGTSTKNYTDRDWDVYRNHRIGFVFQSYNLIPHQTVLGNVELALTISGVGKEERQRRALSALEKVGLKGEEYKRPNQLSGGQCQRVAIARALVNEPDILLADEPTGALDSKTSVQIMELIKEISKEKLVIMVTHNAEIAEQYSTRIVRLFDGEKIEDTNPYTEEEEMKEREGEVIPDAAELKKIRKKQRKTQAKMSWWTAFKLSLRNLFTKRGRTLMTSVAGSIGIIGISAVLAVSTGVKGFIADMQDDMLSGNPITIEKMGMDLNSVMSNMDFEDKVELVKQEGYVNVESMMEYLVEQVDAMDSFFVENEITADYVNYVKGIPKEQATLKLDYGIDVTNNIYTDFARNKDYKENVSLSAIKTIYTSVMGETEFKDQASMIASLGDTFKLAPSDTDYIATQYDLLDGKFATAKDEIMIVVNKDQAITDLTLAQLGYYTQDEFINIAFKLGENPDTANPELNKERFSYQELMGKEFVWYDNDTVYNDNRDNLNPMLAKMNPFTYNYKSDDFSKDSGLELKVVGILQPKEDINYGCLSTGVYYTSGLVEHMLEKNLDSKLVKFLNEAAAAESEEDPLYVYKDGMQSGYYKIPNTDQGYPTGITYSYEYYYDDNLNDDVKPEMKTAIGYVGTANALSSIMNMFMGGGSGEVYTLTARQAAGNDVASSISIYPADFENKDQVLLYLDKWNEEGTVTVDGKEIAFSDRSEVTYTDTLSLIISMINSMIDIITIALIAFTSLSLVVSCVMIAIITYVSVVERVKEIGVIRSLGGRKKDVSNLFNAETLIIGLSSGLVGIGFTYILSAIVNVIVKASAGIAIMKLTAGAAIIMVLLSVLLNTISGLIPSKKAAQQDPVVALRTE
ncbi:MAG: ABC transporter ATP-binding protein/permease [Clostridia bacterium]|nr:ABC transporter ATP-binding protein/permease [Clostridia bacterium]